MRLHIAAIAVVVLPLVAAVPSEFRRVQSRQSSVCGVPGYDKGKPQAFSYSSKAKYSSLAGCAGRCASKSKCRSYAVGDGSCLLYASTVYGISFILHLEITLLTSR